MREIALLTVAVIVGTWVIRLPVLLSPTLAVDGDDSIVGLMAIHLVKHGRVTPFFYGQHYGFSLMEVASAAVSFSIFGISDTALRIGMLPLWCVGVLLFSLAVRRVGGNTAGWVCGLLLVTSPAWLIWSTRARGGYLTAFMLTGLVAFLSTDPRPRRWVVAATGISLGIVALSQPTWLPAAGSLAMLSLRGRWMGRRAATLVVFVAVTAGLLLLAARLQGPATWTPPIIQPDAPLSALAHLPSRLWTMLTGQYHYWYPLPAGPATSTAAWGWCGLVGACMVGTFVTTPRIAMAWASWSGSVATGLLTLAMNNLYFGFRYLLPAAVLTSVSAAVLVARWWRRGGVRRMLMVAWVTTLCALGVGAGVEIGNHDRSAEQAGIPDRASTKALVGYLLDHGVHYVYCADDNLQWTIMFLSHDTIAARACAPVDRVARYPAAVDGAVLAGMPVALVGWVAPEKAIESYLAEKGYSSLRVVHIGRFFVVHQPPRTLLEENGFRVDPPEGTATG